MPLRSSRDIDDCAVHDCAFAGSARGENSGNDAEGEPQRAAGVAENGRGRDRLGARTLGQRQNAAQRQIVEIMARRLRQRPILPPAGHPAVDEPRIAFRAIGGAETEPLHHARPVALDQRVGGLDQRHRLLDRLGPLEVERDDPLAAPQRQIRVREVEVVEPRLVRADDRDHFRALVGQHAAGERPRADALELDDFQTGQRTHHSEVLACGAFPSAGVWRASPLTYRSIDFSRFSPPVFAHSVRGDSALSNFG